MATAKRVAQDAKVEGGFRKYTRQRWSVMTDESLREVARIKVGQPYLHVDDDRRWTPQPDRVVLDLSEDEAETLQIIAAMIGGSPGGRRGIANRIWEALVSVGVPVMCNHGDVQKNGLLFPSIAFTSYASGLKEPHPSTVRYSDAAKDATCWGQASTPYKG